MFIVDCKHPGCGNYAHFKVPMKDWDCGLHEKPKKSYLPSRHPARRKNDGTAYNYGSKDNHQ